MLTCCTCPHRRSLKDEDIELEVGSHSTSPLSELVGKTMVGYLAEPGLEGSCRVVLLGALGLV